MDGLLLLPTLQSLTSLGQVIQWALARTPRAQFSDVVVQDEYTHDVVLRISPSLYAVFDTT